jgi:hypothetical protein
MSSGNYDFTVNAADIVREAMLNIGAIGEGEVATAQEYTDCLRKLNMIVKQWMGKQDFAPGLKMWTRQRGDLFLGWMKYQYQLGPTGDNWAGALTSGALGQTFSQTQLSQTANMGDTQIFVYGQNTGASGINVGDQIGIQYAPTLITSTGNTVPSGGIDLYWTTVTSVSVSGANTYLVAINGVLTGTAAQGGYVFNYTSKQQRPLHIETVVLRDVNDNDIPLTRMTLEDYEQLSTKTMNTSQSDPTAFYYETQLGNGQFYIDVGGAQDVTKTLHIVFLRTVQDFDNPGDNPEYPQQWYRALCWGLSREITGMFDAVWTGEMTSNYLEAMAMAREADSEVTSFYFQTRAGSPFEP